MFKISILGDIMCEGPFLDAARKRKILDFCPAFTELKEFLSDSDYIIGNLETPLAGELAGYTVKKVMYSFNTPDVFIKAIKELGVDLVLTANNHCFDRGRTGLERTLKILDENGIQHTGTFTNPRDAVPFIFNIAGTRIAVVSCTESTNPNRIQSMPTVDNVNLLKEQKRNRMGLRTTIKRKIIGEYRYMQIKKLIGKQPSEIFIDNKYDVERVEPYVKRVCEQINEAKANSDITIVCPHMGGQFNEKPGHFSEYLMDRFVNAGADVVAASHPHIIQRCEWKEDCICAFSLGNVSMSMSTQYILKEGLPQYGMILHLYIEEKNIQKVTFSFIHIREDRDGYVMVRPISENDTDHYNNIQYLMRRILNDDSFMLFKMQSEYDLNRRTI